MPRDVHHRYTDPLAEIWLGAAKAIGLRVVRTPDAFAATDGRGTLAIAVDQALDSDDSLAQMIFHELCHSLVEGEDSFRSPDWGMDNTGPDHDWREHACLRTQWILTGRYGLRGVFAPTTDFRAFWDQLSGDVLSDRDDRSVQAAIAAVRRADKHPWAPALPRALEASRQVAQATRSFAVGDSLWTIPEPARDAHPSGLPAGEAAATCGDCAWKYTQRGVTKCRQAERKIDDTWPACERFEAQVQVDCLTCGACCRAAYHSVEVSPKDPMVKKRPDYIVDRGTYLEIKRAGDRCSALCGGQFADDGKQERYHCAIYDDRPKTCRDFTLGGEHCLTARRRVGLSL